MATAATTTAEACGASSMRQTLGRLRELMRARGVAAYVVPSGDAHMSEYIAPSDKRRAFVSGFTGSAGTAVVTAAGGAALWTDSRYFLQAAKQLIMHPEENNAQCTCGGCWKLMKDRLPETLSVEAWLAK
ncbi:Xaa-Pro aminopeptidase 1, partial [Pelomyxa schiedti]